MKFYYSDHFPIPLPEGHRFPAKKYESLRLCLIEEGILSRDHLFESPIADEETLLVAHSKEYIEKIKTGNLTRTEQNRIGFPWSEDLVKRVCATVGGTVEAAKTALDIGFSGQLAGGTHHAHRDFGAGYCVFNDQAIAALVMLNEGLVDRVSVLDVDVHQGDGTAAILANEPRVQVISLHGEKNFPFRKYPSDCDFPLPDKMEDDDYLEVLSEALEVLGSFNPDLVLYQGGVDALIDDSIGRLNLSFEGMFLRDLTSFEYFKSRDIPVALALGGGYSKPIDATVKANVGTYRALKKVFFE